MSIHIVDRAQNHLDRDAIIDGSGTYSYEDLLVSSARAAASLLDGRDSLEGDRVAFMVPPSFDYVATQWGIWRAGGVAVPLCLTHPAPELAFVLDDAEPTAVVASPEYASVLAPLADERGIRMLITDQIGTDTCALPDINDDDPAMMLYTSGTTGRPKGVITTHGGLTAQITSLVEAWGWSADDRILLTLPLHHLHGILNVTSCALWSGASCRMLPRFDASQVWEAIASGSLTLFMAVPTIYHRLIEAWHRADEANRTAMSEGARNLRLMVSGSAALPVPVLEEWRTITGHTLLERYGMTEIGMALSNPLSGERRPGFVGQPLPGVEIRTVDESGQPVQGEAPGEVQVRGPGVFRQYWRRPDATAEAFTDDGWFMTGDIAVFDNGAYRLLGRNSVDIIKTGGEKVSALEIEQVLLGHPSVSECAVVGINDDEWGERISAAIVPKDGVAADAAILTAWCREHLAPFKVPKAFHTVDALPRNAMGKVTKPKLVDQLAEL